MGKAILFIGGERPYNPLPEGVPEEGDLVIAADSGLEYALTCGIEPHLAIGDFDSISDKRLLEGMECTTIERYPEDKELTDTELAMKKAIDEGYREIIILGGGGGRLDHLLGIISLFERENPPDRWYASFGSAYLIDRVREFSFEEERLVSFFPLGSDVCRPYSKGLKWELEGLVWRRGDLGISNRQQKKVFEVDVITGTMLMVVPTKSV